MRIRRHSSPSSPGIARRLIASNPWLSVLTSAISKGSKSIQPSLPNPSLSSIPPCEPTLPPPPPERSETRKSSKKVSCEERGRGPGAVSRLPDDVLLKIFDFYRLSSKSHAAHTWPWKRLAHVCQKWRQLVFASPCRLDLGLFCDSKTPVRETLDIWPVLPIIIRSTLSSSPYNNDDGENIFAALEHRDRVCKVELKIISYYLLTRLSTVMREPLPALTGLCLSSNDYAPPVLPDEFLGGSAPNLQHFDLDGIPFPALPKLLLSTTHLVRLRLRRIPHSGYISPEAMASCLATLSNLDTLVLEFQSPRPLSDRENRRPLPLTRLVLPALTTFEFQGVSEYLEDLVAQIDAPQLSRVRSRFFHQLTFDNPQLSKFIDRTGLLKALSRAEVQFLSDVVKITLGSTVGRGKLEFSISCCQPDWQVSSMAQLCGQLSGLVSRIKQLEVRKGCILRSKWPEDMEFAQWLELFDPFVAVEMLGIRKVGQLVVPALCELSGERAAEVLPAMRTLAFRGLDATSPLKDDLRPFVSARRNFNHPVAVLWGT